MALATLYSSARAPILNLRSVNSYVAGSWEEWTGPMNLQNSASRQHGPGPVRPIHNLPSAGASWPTHYGILHLKNAHASLLVLWIQLTSHLAHHACCRLGVDMPCSVEHGARKSTMSS